ncbi:MAG: Ig-like domain-containing protein [Mediterranea sp.]|jgi:hypothetical protein|nr:Ig-like domain-containing protein [Mediterranea sp.]
MMNMIRYATAGMLAIACGFFAACSDDDDKNASVRVTDISVAQAAPGSGSLKELTAYTNSTTRLEVTISPENATYKRLLYSTKHEGILSVNQLGDLTGIRAGVDTLFIQSADEGFFTATFKVNVIQVYKKATSIELAQDEVAIGKGVTFNLADIVSLLPTDANQDAVTYRSNDESVATVDPTSGLLTSVGFGTTTVTVSTTDGSELSKTIAISVKNSKTYEIPAATAIEAWQSITFDEPLVTTKKWSITAVSTQASDDIDLITYGKKDWGVHLLDAIFTGSVSGAGSLPFEFYLGGTSQGGSKIGAIGRGNWNSSTLNLDPPTITLDAPVTIKLACDGQGNIACTVQNSGINGGAPVDFKTMAGVLTVTGLKSDINVITYVTVMNEED